MDCPYRHSGACSKASPPSPALKSEWAKAAPPLPAKLNPPPYNPEPSNFSASDRVGSTCTLKILRMPYGTSGFLNDHYGTSVLQRPNVAPQRHRTPVSSRAWRASRAWHWTQRCGEKNSWRLQGLGAVAHWPAHFWPVRYGPLCRSAIVMTKLFCRNGLLSPMGGLAVPWR